ncbi:hypothetical protein [Micromonospora sp. b486]|uniref:hypothetical protein n=1 Tax=Micromonospora sp. b486 TaxID=3053986 RepID=UPI00259D10C9|nr:hypothetical protein [Micromonospora sp. b486]MDM4784533.1 hypothetical protein [Micromonospora sp. b486]
MVIRRFELGRRSASHSSIHSYGTIGGKITPVHWVCAGVVEDAGEQGAVDGLVLVDDQGDVLLLVDRDDAAGVVEAAAQGHEHGE